MKREGGTTFSPTLRVILREQYGVEAGLCSRGWALKPGVLPPGTRVGNYTCLAAGLSVLRRNHTYDRFSQHPIFFNHKLGFVRSDTIKAVEDNPLLVGADVWLGANATVCPGCRRIGDGAIVAAEAVVTKDVPPYTVVGGNPAKVIRRRYSAEVEQTVAASRWWERSPEDLKEIFELFCQPITEEILGRFRQYFALPG
jgi:hypothetical protein